MILRWWLVATCMLAAALIVAFPVRRRRSIVTASQAPPLSVCWGFLARRSRWPLALRPTMSLTVGLLAASAWILAGPVATVVTAAYGGLFVQGVCRRRESRAAIRDRGRTLDALCALAAELRAGLPPSVPTDLPDARINRLTAAAGRLAEWTGAPLADLVERIEADARAMDRGRAAAAAQAAGARATAWLLAGLPLGGIALGYGIGTDPLQVLLRTPIGAGCAISAVVLQLIGLAWANRLAPTGATAVA